MKSTVIFIALQYIIGFAFAVGGIFLWAEKDTSSLMTSIFYGFLVGFICMLAGVGLVGYFHLRVKHILYRFGTAMALSLAGLLVFLVLYIFIESLLPKEFGIFSLFLPLTGAVFGFNLAVAKTIKKDLKDSET